MTGDRSTDETAGQRSARAKRARPERVDLKLAAPLGDLVPPPEDPGAAPARDPKPVPGRVAAPLEPLPEEREEAPPPPKRRRGHWGKALGAVFAAVAGLALWDLGSGIAAVWEDSLAAGAALTLLALTALGAVAAAVAAEARALARLDRVARLHGEIVSARERDSHHLLRRALEPFLQRVAARRPEIVRDFRSRIEGASDVDAILADLRLAVLEPLDREARQAVRGHAFTILGATAISPHPALDALLVVWRSVAMIRGIAEIYGLRPTPLATLKLSRMVMASATLAMVADPAAEGAAEALGGGVATKLTGRLAEGSVSGLRVLRLGLKTLDLVRPVPFRAEERRGLFQTLAGERPAAA